MNFGLGLVLSFTDRATAGINQAVNSLSVLTSEASRASDSLESLALGTFSNITGQMGASLTNYGKGILGIYSQAISSVNSVGQTLMYAQGQLDTLYGDAEKGAEVMANIAEYAKTSIFEFEDLIGIVTMLKATGIEAFEQISNTAGTTSQTLMDYASDLAAFNPTMHNMYGTGIAAAMGALKEYIAEGNKRSLLSGAGLDITGILGEEKGKTIEERSRQVADLITQIGMVGMTASLANTPMTKLSNMHDTLFQLMGKIADSGVYEAYNKIITVFADFVNNIPEEKLNALAEVLGGALSDLLKPVVFLAEKIVDLADAFSQLLLNNPKLAEFIVKAGALVGVLTVLGGGFLTILSILGRVAAGVQLFFSLWSTLPAVIAGGMSKILVALAPIALILGTILFVWKTDLLGIRTAVTDFVKGVVNSFQTARNLIKGDLGTLQTALQEFDTKNDFFSGLTKAIMRVQSLAQGLSEGWDDYTLSEDTYLKAKELGVLPLLEALFDLKYRLGFLKDGFVEFFDTLKEKVSGVWTWIEEHVDGTIFETLFDKVTSFFRALASGDPELWRQMGIAFGALAASGATLILFTKVIPLLLKLAAPIMIIYGAFLAITNFIDMWKNGLDRVKLAMMAIGIMLATIGAAILGIVSWPAIIVAAIIAGVLAVVLFVKEHWERIKEFFTDDLPNAIKSFFKGIWDFIQGVFTGFVNLLYTVFIKTPIALVKLGVKGIIALIKTIWTGVKWVLDKIEKGLDLVFGFIGKILEGILEVAVYTISFIGEGIAKFIELVMSIPEKIQGVIETAINFITSIPDRVQSAISGIGDFFSETWDTIKSGAQTAYDVVCGIFDGFVSFFADLFTRAWDGVVAVFQLGGTIFDGFTEGVETIFKDIVNGLIDGINTVILEPLGAIADGLNEIRDIKVLGKRIFGFLPEISIEPIPPLATGGIISSPTTALIGEDGTEAVMPLERNTGWLGKLSQMLVRDMASVSMLRAPSNITPNTTSGGYISNNSNTANTTNDNSVVFSRGAITIVANNSSDAEAEKMANKIISIIKRKAEIDGMLNYN